MFHELTFKTRLLHPSEINGSKALSKFEIVPKFNEMKWNYTLLTAFLNELQTFKPVKTSCTKVRDKLGNEFMMFAFEDNDLRIYIKIRNEIQVSVPKAYILQSPHWIRYEINTMSQIGSQGRETKTLKLKKMIFYEWRVQPNSGTIALYTHKSLIFNAISDFTLCFQYFSKKFNELHVPNNDDTCSIYEFISMWINDRKTAITKLEKLIPLLSGYLHLNIQVSPRKKHLQTVKYEDKMYYIISGVYISPFAESIIKKNPGLIQGFLLDTTWKVLPYYVTSILMASGKNVGIPLAFAFGRGETKISYETLIDVVQTQCNFSFSGLILESDQGKALQMLCKKYEIKQILCLRHFLASINDHYIRTLIGELVKAISISDHCTAAELIITQIEQNMNKFPAKVVTITQSLEKIGVTYEMKAHTLTVTDSMKWEMVSMQARTTF